MLQPQLSFGVEIIRYVVCLSHFMSRETYFLLLKLSPNVASHHHLLRHCLSLCPNCETVEVIDLFTDMVPDLVDRTHWGGSQDKPEAS